MLLFNPLTNLQYNKILHLFSLLALTLMRGALAMDILGEKAPPPKDNTQPFVMKGDTRPPPVDQPKFVLPSHIGKRILDNEETTKFIDVLKDPSCTEHSEQSDKVTWKYSGSFLNGTQHSLGIISATLGEGKLLPIVNRALEGMCVGEKRMVIIDYVAKYKDLAPQIPVNESLLYDIDVRRIEKSGAASKDDKIKLKWITRRGCFKESAERDFIVYSYTGSLLDGTQFTKGTNRTIIGKGDILYGVEQGLKGVCPGDRREMTIHPDWGYGDQKMDSVPAGSTLVFRIEVTKVNDLRPPRDEL